jgi:hypothetical protein
LEMAHSAPKKPVEQPHDHAPQTPHDPALQAGSKSPYSE